MAKQFKETYEYMTALKKYNTLAKKADRRMRELERFSRYDEFKDIKKYAYRKAEAMIKKWTPPDKMYDERAPRWQRNTPMDTRTLKAKIKDIEEFLEMKSSTLKGVKEIYKNRTEAINKKYGTKFTWQQLAHFFEDGGLADKAFDKYGSATVLLAYGKIQNNKSKALDAIADFNERNKITDNDIATQETINGLLSNYGYDLQELLESR